MHIGQINTNPEWGGGENQVLQLVRGLEQRGVRVTLFAHAAGELLRRAQACGCHVYPLPAGRGALRAMEQALVNEGVDLLHVHDSRGAALGARLGRRLRLPVVLSRRVASPLRRNPFSRQKYTRRNFAAVIAISHTVREVFLRTSDFPAGDVYVVPTGVDIRALDAVQPDADWRRSVGRPYVVGGVGKLSVKKNWQFLVRVAARMSEAQETVSWVIAGDGDQHGPLALLIRQLGVQDRVKLLGFRDDASRILKSLDVCFFPSIVEGASVTVRECMALGTPVVAVNAAGTAESLAGHGWLVEDGDVDGAVRAIREALSDGPERNRRVETACLHARECYSYDRTVDGTLDVYRKVLAL